MKNKSKILFVLISIVLFAGLIYSYDYTTAKELVYKVDAGAKLRIENISGQVKIDSWDKGEIWVKYTMTVEGRSKEDAEEDANRIKIKTKRSGNLVEITVDYDNHNIFKHRDMDAMVDFEVKVPANCNLDISNVSGDILINNINAEVKTENVSGNIFVKRTKGVLNMDNVSGDVNVNDHQGKLILQIVSGDAILTGIDGTIDTEGVSGDIKIENAKSSRLKAETVSGDLKFNGEFTGNAVVTFDSVSGNINLNLPKNSGIDYDMSSFSGELVIIQADGKRIAKSRETEGTIGDAKIRLRIETLSGDAIITLK
jgi:DUF4097 and DUF4098 domain-containing protein YvlB